MRIPTEQQIRAMTPEQRTSLLTNAKRIGGEEGNAVVSLLSSLNLPFLSGGMPQDHPLYLEMHDIINSAEGKAAALKSVDAGLPAMAGIDPLLQERLGNRYTNEQQMTVNAGYIAGTLMYSLGYDKDKEGVALPSGCIAKSSTTWKLKRSLKP
jgi:hypothetical protein